MIKTLLHFEFSFWKMAYIKLRIKCLFSVTLQLIKKKNLIYPNLQLKGK